MLTAESAQARVGQLERELARSQTYLQGLEAERTKRTRQLMNAQGDVQRRRAERELARVEQQIQGGREHLSRIESMLAVALEDVGEAEAQQPALEAAEKAFAQLAVAFGKRAKDADRLLAELSDALRALLDTCDEARDVLAGVGVRKVEPWKQASRRRVADAAENAIKAALGDLIPGLKVPHQTREKYANGLAPVLGELGALQSYFPKQPPPAA